MSISVDGFVAGPDQGADDPVGVGGLKLHEWHWHARDPGHEADGGAAEDLLKPRGAYVMGRNMFGPIRGEWDRDWRGWWGDEPPYHAPVFVLTHHAHEPIKLEGGTTFHFVTAGFDIALSQAKAAAGAGDVGIAGGASTVRQAMAAGAIDELILHIVPVLIYSGERLFDGVEEPGLEPVEVIHSPRATHVRTFAPRVRNMHRESRQRFDVPARRIRRQHHTHFVTLISAGSGLSRALCGTTRGLPQAPKCGVK